MRPLFGSPVGRGAPTPSCNLGDFLVGASSVTIGGAAPGVLRHVYLRYVLGLFLRMRGFVGLVLVVNVGAVPPTPSVAASSPSEFGKARPFVIASIAFLKSLMAAFLGLFFKRWMLSTHSCATSLLCCWSDSVGSWQCCGSKSCDDNVLYALFSGM